MEINENIAGLGKSHDEATPDNDLPKKQSQAAPAAENIDMQPNSVNKNGEKGFDDSSTEEKKDGPIHDQAEEYAKQEHEKADNWENTNETGPDRPQF